MDAANLTFEPVRQEYENLFPFNLLADRKPVLSFILWSSVSILMLKTKVFSLLIANIILSETKDDFPSFFLSLFIVQNLDRSFIFFN